MADRVDQVTENELGSLLAELMEEYSPPHQEPGDITHSSAMKYWRVGQKKALDLLGQMVADGKVTCIEGAILDNGKRGRVWRPVKKGKV